ncbi:separin-like [Tubulanus polymorphus]|uniref:separin-like n=1 Tax=Tubulanus polymorphus TaxID=672921 RepID=UPI003DA68A43
MEEKLLRPWKGLLLSEPADESNRQRLQQAASAVSRICEKLGCSLDAECQQMLRILLNSAHLYDDIQPLYQAVKESFPAVSEANARQIAAAIRKYSNKLESAALKRSPLILVLDRLLQMMPWDSIPMLINHPVSRMLSIYAISAELRLHGEDDTSVYNVGVDARKAYYILDPDNNLPHTKQTFSKWFKKQGWPGICGSLPSADDYKDALTNNDLFMYLGHGSGTRYVKGEILQSIQSRVVSFIMGCSSGLLQVQGDLEVTGTMLNYLFSGGPVAIGNLWDITDRDIDRFFEQLITAWFRSAEGTTINELMCQARSICRMQFLNGAAPAIYGLPVGLKFAELKS